MSESFKLALLSFILVFSQRSFAQEAGTFSKGTATVSITIPENLKSQLPLILEGKTDSASSTNFPGAYLVEVRNLKNEYQSARLISDSTSLKSFKLSTDGIIILIPQ
jgi:hypothetical protein